MAPYHARVTAAGLACDSSIVHGVPFQVIIETARTAHIDLIIMGTHGRTGLRHVLLGSVAERVVRLLPAPCWWCVSPRTRRGRGTGLMGYDRGKDGAVG